MDLAVTLVPLTLCLELSHSSGRTYFPVENEDLSPFNVIVALIGASPFFLILLGLTQKLVVNVWAGRVWKHTFL